MKALIRTGTLLLAISTVGIATAQSSIPAPPQPQAPSAGHEPPPQAYADCKGKKAGDTVQHTTREGKVAAICEASPNGLVARPKHAMPDPGAVSPKQ
jgi:hypothetical protein